MKEVLINNHRTLLVENNKISIVILLDKGADIIELNYKKTDTEFMWRSPAGLDLLNQTKTKNMCYVGGWFEIFPNMGEDTTYLNEPMPQYGDVNKIPWEYSVIRDEPEMLKLKLFVRSTLLPLYLEKVMTLKIDDASIYFEEKATNLSNMSVDFTWGHHPNLGAPFLNEDCIIELPDCDISDFSADETGKMIEKNIGRWPYKDKGNGKVDLSKIPARDIANEMELLYLKNLKGNWVSVRNTKTGLGFGLIWDEKVFKNLALWRAFDAVNWNYIFGHRYILCLLLKTNHCHLLGESIKHNEQIVLKPGESVETWLVARVFEEEFNKNR